MSTKKIMWNKAELMINSLYELIDRLIILSQLSA